MTAVVMQQAGSDRGRVDEATLLGAAEVHQDPPDGKTQGTDITGNKIFMWNRGENRARLQAHGIKGKDAKALSPGRMIEGPILEVDQADDHAWVKGRAGLKWSRPGPIS